MLPHEIDSIAARHVPGTGKPDVHALRMGLINDTYRVVRDGRAYALRVAASNPCDLGLDRAWEARVVGGAAHGGFAPALEFCDPRLGILVARWADGRSWSSGDARLPSNLARMAALIRGIHALPMPESPRVMSPSTWIDYYTEAIGKSAGPLRAAAPAQGSAAILRFEARARLAALAALPSADPVLCHSDLHTLNLIDSGRTLVLLDWEYAHASDPLWDLAGWSANNDFEEELRRELLADYTGRRPTPDEYSRLQLLGWLFDYIALLWSELYLMRRSTVQGRSVQGEVSARAEILAARLIASKVVEPGKFRHTTPPSDETHAG
jgi:thiamine kinase